MITPERACEIATAYRHMTYVLNLCDIGRGYVLDVSNTDESLLLPLLLVDKNSGKPTSYSWTDEANAAELVAAKDLPVPKRFQFSRDKY